MQIFIQGPTIPKEQLTNPDPFRRLFPNVTTLGSFSPHSTTVQVDIFRTQLVRDCMASEDLLPVRQDLQVLCHEMTHWFDFFGTIWGRQYIKRICRAYDAMHENKEKLFSHIVDLYDFDRRVLSPDYYRYADEPTLSHDPSRPWSIDYSAGCEFSANGKVDKKRPIFFAKFGENHNRRQFARQPISVGSLLEVRAMTSELLGGLAAINTSEDDSQRRIEGELLRREMKELAYDPHLTEYTVAAHVLSVQSGTHEFVVTYRQASRLAYVVLNMQARDFRRLKTPDQFRRFGSLNKIFKKNEDRGYAFACIAFNGDRYLEDDDANFVEKCLELSGLDSSETILSRASRRLAEDLELGVSSIEIDYFTEVAKRSIEIGDVLSSHPDRCLSLESIFANGELCPPFSDSEGNVAGIAEGAAEKYKMLQMHSSGMALGDYTTNFLSGCRGVMRR